MHPANGKNNKSWLIIHLNYDKRSLLISMWKNGCDRVHGSEANGVARKFFHFRHNLGFSDR
jgi:hypothetical protein